MLTVTCFDGMQANPDGGTDGPPLPTPIVTRRVEDDENLALSIVEAVAAASNVPPDELPRLEDTIDTDALNDLFAGRSSEGRVTFRFAGYRVSVFGDEIRIYDTEPPATSPR